MSEKNVTGLAKKLITEKLLSEEVVLKAKVAAEKEKITLAHYLISKQIMAKNIIMRLNAELFCVPVFDITALNLELIPKNILPENKIRQYSCLPLLKRGKTLFVGMANQNDQEALNMLRFQTHLTVESILVDEGDLKKIIDKLYENMDALVDDFDDDLTGLSVENEIDVQESQTPDTDDAPIVKFVHKMLLSAIKMGGSDLHFEPYEKTYRVRFRIDGILQEIARPPVSLSRRISSRLKIMANMDISERRNPQDGRVKLKISKTKAINFRVNTLPTLWGEKIVMRVLDSTSAQLGIDKLGYSEEQKELFMKALNQPQGMILATGPTGSGKTVSLYTALNILNTTERNISTAEDPVEIYLEGINQVNVNIKQGLDFSKALRAFLRQDPDVIMVGEIRDTETANIAIKAAQTGHLVLSTLHTNSAAETLTRLINMGVPAFNIATSVSLIIAQRLARRLCPQCRIGEKIQKDILIKQGMNENDLSDVMDIYHANVEGCDNCIRGYKGRIGIFEVVILTKNLQNVILKESNSLEIAAQARADGFLSLRDSGLKKVLEGETSLEEVNRVTLD